MKFETNTPLGSPNDVHEAVSSKQLCRACGRLSWVGEMYVAHGKGTILTCGFCGTGTSVFSTGTDAASAYTDTYYAYDETNYPSWRWRVKLAIYRIAQHAIVRAVLGRFVSFVPPARRGRVLDVGCSIGTFLDLMARLGWETYGTEILPAIRKKARNKGHVVVAPCDFGELPPDSFNWVTLNNVLEHIEHPEELLEAIKPLLTLDGVLSICVPNFACVDSHLFREHWQALELPYHYSHFSSSGLIALLGRTGFEVRALRFLPRYAYRESMRRVSQTMTETERRRLSIQVLSVQLRKTVAWLMGSIDSNFGFFIVIDAVRRNNKNANFEHS